MIRTVKSKVALMDSHVGEELWDAAKLFCSHLCRTAFVEDCDDAALMSHKKQQICGKRLRGKNVLELGAGVGALGMCVAALGADQVVCTDYDEDVLENLKFNVERNMSIVYDFDLEKSVERSFDHLKLSVSKLDWNAYVSKDVKAMSWMDSCEIDTMSHQDTLTHFKPDIVIGSALIYSSQGALCCADTIHYLLAEKKANECWILQMPDRPGFDRFLMRLEHLGLTYESSQICEETFMIAELHMGKIMSNMEDFQMYVVRQNVP